LTARQLKQMALATSSDNSISSSVRWRSVGATPLHDLHAFVADDASLATVNNPKEATAAFRRAEIRMRDDCRNLFSHCGSVTGKVDEKTGFYRSIGTVPDPEI
jgi:hypothetical protein